MSPHGMGQRAAVARTAALRGARSLASFEAVFLAFLFAGTYKASPPWSWVPLDLTLLTFLASALCGAIVLAKRCGRLSRRGLLLVSAYLLFVSFMGLSLLWSASVHYGPRLVLQAGSLVLGALAGAALVIAPERERVRRFLGLVVGFGLLYAVLGLVKYLMGPTRDGVLVGSAGYQDLGLLIGLAAIVLFGYAYTELSGFTRLLAVGAFAFTVFLLLVAGARAALLSVVVCVLALPVARLGLGLLARRPLAPELNRAKPFAAVAALALLVVAPFHGRFLTLQRLQRVFDLSAPNLGDRDVFLTQSVEQWTGSPVWGTGAGSWPINAGYGDIVAYPHNLFAQTLVEQGATGLALLLMVLLVAAVPARWSRTRGPDGTSTVLGSLFLVGLLNAVTSGDFAQSRVFFALVGLLVARHRAVEARGGPDDRHAGNGVTATRPTVRAEAGADR